MARISAVDAGGINVLAFLDLIAVSEIGRAMLAMPETDDGYRVLVGSTPHKLLLFNDYSRHPQILNHALNSTAAGRYQIIRGTWLGVAGELKHHGRELPDFSPVSQDRAAIELIRGRGALPEIQHGNIERAIELCNQEWASFPGAGATLPDGKPQHEGRMTDLLNAYELARARYA
jgi:muramidase (phage lysozyme)